MINVSSACLEDIYFLFSFGLITPNYSFQLHTSLSTKYSGQQEISGKKYFGKTAVKESLIFRNTRLASTKY
jgi:hypothetical protein